MSFLKNILGGKSKSDQSFLEGDIFYTFSENKFQLYKLLKVDNGTFHVLAYETLSELPKIDDIKDLKVQIFHFPIEKTGFTNAKLLTKSNVTENDLLGYKEYLRLTQEDDEIINQANNYYQIAYYLTDENKNEEAIANYSKAIELVPDFFQAIDNRAFCKMNLRLFNEAIEDFRKSLLVNPNSFLAEFSIGECYLRLGECEEAKEQFEKAVAINPSDESSQMFLRTAIECIENKSKD